jgi:hypothetical protein
VLPKSQRRGKYDPVEFQFRYEKLLVEQSENPQKEPPMKHIMNITVLALGSVVLPSLLTPGFTQATEFRAAAQSASIGTSSDRAVDSYVRRADSTNPSSDHPLVLDIAVDCNTVVSGTTRGATFIINGKIFPGGTFPNGAANNDPVKAYKGVAPIGEYVVRGQHEISLNPPPDPFSIFDPTTYYYKNYVKSSVPLGLATAYFILNGGQSAIITEGYDLGPNLPPPGALLTIVGGIGAYSGAAGDLTDNIIGSNVTTCANSRVTFNIQPGSVRGSSNH